MVKVKHILVGLALLGGAVFLHQGLDSELKVVEYNIETPKVSNNLKVMVLADIHSQGSTNQRIQDELEYHRPDVVLLVGDIVEGLDGTIKNELDMIDLISNIGGKYKTYFVQGNHDGEVSKSFMDNLGVKVLTNQQDTIDIKDSKLVISGLDEAVTAEEMLENRRQLGHLNPFYYNILMVHRPDFYEELHNKGEDLIISGHTHGGLWSVPVLVEGLIVRNQDWFNRYVGGYYKTDEGRIIVSRGVEFSRAGLPPRFYTDPEIVIVNINPRK